MKIFILDDEIHTGGWDKRDRLKTVLAGHELTTAISYLDAIEKYVGGYHLLLLDHDMEGKHEHDPAHLNTGFRFVKWLANREIAIPTKQKAQFIVHSQNSRGRKRMLEYLLESGYHGVEIPFSEGYLTFLRKAFGLNGNPQA